MNTLYKKEVAIATYYIILMKYVLEQPLDCPANIAIYRSAVAIEKGSFIILIYHKWFVTTWPDHIIIKLFTFYVLPIELLTDVTTFRAAIAAKILLCVTTFYFNTTLLLQSQISWHKLLHIELLSQLKIVMHHYILL